MKKAALALLLFASILPSTPLFAMDDAIHDQTPLPLSYLEREIFRCVHENLTGSSQSKDKFFSQLRLLKDEVNTIRDKMAEGKDTTPDDRKRAFLCVYTYGSQPQSLSAALKGISSFAFFSPESENEPLTLVDKRVATFYIDELRQQQSFLDEDIHILALTHLAKLGLESAIDLWHSYHKELVGKIGVKYNAYQEEEMLRLPLTEEGVPQTDGMRVDHIVHRLLVGKEAYPNEMMRLMTGSGIPGKPTGILDYLPHPKAQGFIARTLTQEKGCVYDVLVELLRAKTMITSDDITTEQILSRLAINEEKKGKDSHTYYEALALYYTCVLDTGGEALMKLLKNCELSKNIDAAQSIRNVIAVALSRLTGENAYTQIGVKQRGILLREILFPEIPSTKVPNTAQYFWATALTGALKKHWRVMQEDDEQSVTYADFFGMLPTPEGKGWGNLLAAADSGNISAQKAVIDLLTSIPNKQLQADYAEYAKFLTYYYKINRLMAL
ncbi:MAG: hypothetical protein K2X98_03715 [Alphaproteobacteria bacterium]|nr:hypothetical protein [Alphaproteobacteria bacterium]